MPRNQRPSTVHRHPLVAAYLQDLDRALAGADDGERQDVLASVEEHIEEAMASGRHQDQDVGGVLDRLGPVERIAREVTARGTPALDQATEGSQLSGYGLAVAAGVALGLLVFVPLLAVPLALVVGVLAISGIRERRQPGWLYWAAAGLSVVTLLTAVWAGVTLVAAGGSEPPVLEAPVSVPVAE